MDVYRRTTYTFRDYELSTLLMHTLSVISVNSRLEEGKHDYTTVLRFFLFFPFESRNKFNLVHAIVNEFSIRKNEKKNKSKDLWINISFIVLIPRFNIWKLVCNIIARTCRINSNVYLWKRYMALYRSLGSRGSISKAIRRTKLSDLHANGIFTLINYLCNKTI